MPNNSFCSLNNKVARETEFQGRGTNYPLYFKLTLRTIPPLPKKVEQGTKQCSLFSSKAENEEVANTQITKLILKSLFQCSFSLCPGLKQTKRTYQKQMKSYNTTTTHSEEEKGFKKSWEK